MVGYCGLRDTAQGSDLTAGHPAPGGEQLLLAINATTRVGVGLLIERIAGIPVAFASRMLCHRPVIARAVAHMER